MMVMIIPAHDDDDKVDVNNKCLQTSDSVNWSVEEAVVSI